MARPTFSQPATVAKSVPQTKPSKPKLETPHVEHTISIKLDNNNADEDDLKGPRESLSRDPVDVPRAKPRPKKQAVNEFQPEHDKETKTPPTEKEDAFKKPLASAKEIQKTEKKEVVVPKQKDRTKETKELDPTQEIKATVEEQLVSAKSPPRKKLKNKADASKKLSILSIKSSRPKVLAKTPPVKKEATKELEPTQEANSEA
uniref:Uncharacterized protein n=1 Tax=Panagrolaimus sp. JU765 TaxID=591449 RepID=A0AC34R7W6_9BILA